MLAGGAIALLVLAAVGSGAVAARARAASAPSVQSMIVGRGGAIIAPAEVLAAGATSLRVDGRACAVAAGTPLAVLAAVRRAGGPGFALRDYGHCGSSSAASADLFVYSVGGESNRGQNGWEYKVDDVAGSTGAGDPSGPMGDGGRLRSGDRMLWFWCEAAGTGCQRSLELDPSSTHVARRGSLTISVTGFDNEGRAAPVSGATVTLGSGHASTGTHGRATLLAPSAPGRYRLQATRQGLVPAFPWTIVVR